MQPNILFLIAIGGGLGAVARHYLSTLVYKFADGGFPWGILAVNVLGGLLMGIIAGIGAFAFSFPPAVRALLVTGLLGGFTTFSAFSLDTVLLIERSDWAGAALYVGSSVSLSVGAVFAGLWLARSFA